MPAERIAQICLVVPDYDAGLDFYCRVLGWPCLTDLDLGGGKRWVTVAPPGGGASLLLAEAASPAQEAAIGNQTGGRVGFFLETDDFDTRYQQMSRAGVHFIETPRHEAYGTVAVWRDPFGNLWDLLERS